MMQKSDLKQVLADSEERIFALIAATALASSVLELLTEEGNREVFTRVSLSAWNGLARLLRRAREDAQLLIDDLEIIGGSLG